MNDRRPLEKHVVRFIEGELLIHRARVRQIERLKVQIATERPVFDGEGRGGGGPSDPTFSRVLALQRNNELQYLTERVRLIEECVNLMTELERRVVVLLYVERRFNTEGAGMFLRISARHVRRLRETAFLQLAVGMGVVQ